MKIIFDMPTKTTEVVLGRSPAEVQNMVSSDESITGVLWHDTDWTECRDHLLDNGWRNADGPFDRGTIIRGDVSCDACAEARKEADL